MQETSVAADLSSAFFLPVVLQNTYVVPYWSGITEVVRAPKLESLLPCALQIYKTLSCRSRSTPLPNLKLSSQLECAK
jgi:hypothetical protein